MENQENQNLCIASIGGLSVWDFCTPENAAVKLEEAKAYHAERLVRYAELSREHPEENFSWARDALEQEKVTEYEIMPFDDFLKKQREKLLSGPLEECAEEEFEDMFDVLPPRKWCKRHGVEQFCMCEMYTATFTTQYAHDHATGKYYKKMVDVCDASTWISEILYPAA